MVDSRTKGDTLGSRVRFLMIFNGFGSLLGVYFLSGCLFFFGSRLSILSVSSEMSFLMGLGKKIVPESVVGCVENMVNTVVFMRFHFSTYLVNWLISN